MENKHWRKPESIRSGAIDIVVIDSVAALTQKVRLKVKWEILKWDFMRLMSQA
jgi:RecA/RadA recombinase